MRIIAIILLIALFALQSFVKTSMVAYYQLNKEYIASTLCENKDKPTLKCQGKCYLNKKIKEQERQESRPLSVLKSLKDSADFFAEYSFYFSFSSLKNLNTQHTNYNAAFYPSPIQEIIHPPC